MMITAPAVAIDSASASRHIFDSRAPATVAFSLRRPSKRRQSRHTTEYSCSSANAQDVATRIVQEQSQQQATDGAGTSYTSPPPASSVACDHSPPQPLQLVGRRVEFPSDLDDTIEEIELNEPPESPMQDSPPARINTPRAWQDALLPSPTAPEVEPEVAKTGGAPMRRSTAAPRMANAARLPTAWQMPVSPARVAPPPPCSQSQKPSSPPPSPPHLPPWASSLRGSRRAACSSHSQLTEYQRLWSELKVEQDRLRLLLNKSKIERSDLSATGAAKLTKYLELKALLKASGALDASVDAAPLLVAKQQAPLSAAVPKKQPTRTAASRNQRAPVKQKQPATASPAAVGRAAVSRAKKTAVRSKRRSGQRVPGRRVPAGWLLKLCGWVTPTRAQREFLHIIYDHMRSEHVLISVIAPLGDEERLTRAQGVQIFFCTLYLELALLCVSHPLRLQQATPTSMASIVTQGVLASAASSVALFLMVFAFRLGNTRRRPRSITGQLVCRLCRAAAPILRSRVELRRRKKQPQLKPVGRGLVAPPGTPQLAPSIPNLFSLRMACVERGIAYHTSESTYDLQVKLDEAGSHEANTMVVYGARKEGEVDQAWSHEMDRNPEDDEASLPPSPPSQERLWVNAGLAPPQAPRGGPSPAQARQSNATSGRWRGPVERACCLIAAWAFNMAATATLLVLAALDSLTFSEAEVGEVHAAWGMAFLSTALLLDPLKVLCLSVLPHCVEEDSRLGRCLAREKIQVVL